MSNGGSGIAASGDVWQAKLSTKLDNVYNDLRQHHSTPAGLTRQATVPALKLPGICYQAPEVLPTDGFITFCHIVVFIFALME
jgi:hypothetical protein